jgi:hypothetical protein
VFHHEQKLHRNRSKPYASTPPPTVKLKRLLDENPNEYTMADIEEMNCRLI